MPVGERLFVGREHELSTLSEAVFDGTNNLITIFGFGGEGKTTFITRWIKLNLDRLSLHGIDAIFECSFYKADAAFFIDSAYSFLCPSGEALGLATKLSELKAAITSKKTLFVFDGFEAIQLEDGRIATPAIGQMIDVIKSSGSIAIFTTRTLPSFSSCVIDLQHLTTQDTINVLRAWNLKGSTAEFRKAIRNNIGKHALSVRLIAGYLDRINARHILQVEKIDSLAQIDDEADTRSANKAQRLLEYYWTELDEKQKQFMVAFSLLRRSTSLSMLMDTVLDKRNDWEQVEEDLLTRRLLIIEDEGTLTAHPLVKLFFANKGSNSESKRLHRIYSAYFESLTKSTHPTSLVNAQPLIEACYHAALGELWDDFHRIFDHRLNNGVARLLGEVLGAWEDFLELVELVRQLKGKETITSQRPDYYESAAAYALKKLES